jgi:hypothetical protein
MNPHPNSYRSSTSKAVNDCSCSLSSYAHVCSIHIEDKVPRSGTRIPFTDVRCGLKVCVCIPFYASVCRKIQSEQLRAAMRSTKGGQAGGGSGSQAASYQPPVDIDDRWEVNGG